MKDYKAKCCALNNPFLEKSSLTYLIFYCEWICGEYRKQLFILIRRSVWWASDGACWACCPMEIDKLFLLAVLLWVLRGLCCLHINDTVFIFWIALRINATRFTVGGKAADLLLFWPFRICLPISYSVIRKMNVMCRFSVGLIFFLFVHPALLQSLSDGTWLHR